MNAVFLPEPNTLKYCQLSQIHYLEKGVSVYSQGDRAKAFYYLRSGLIGLYHMLENGKESLVRIYHSNEYFGFRTLFGDHYYHCSAKVLQPAEVVYITPQHQQEFLEKNPELAGALIKQLASELHYAEHRLSQISYQKTYERVASNINYLTENYPDYPWTYREIAEFSGCETETAIRISRELKKQGVLLQNRHLKVKSG